MTCSALLRKGKGKAPTGKINPQYRCSCEARHRRKHGEWFHPCGVHGDKSQRRGRAEGAGGHKDTPAPLVQQHGLRTIAKPGLAERRDKTQRPQTRAVHGLLGAERASKVFEDEDLDVTS